ncbi:hypothetical protein [Frankia tisae]|uniref:hypothetical protein n=1 Tax=Frankia tisae TaxID=2950104 RepID=UPI0021BEE676|nr:hypothetical protein [Frankia tisae]
MSKIKTFDGGRLFVSLTTEQRHWVTAEAARRGVKPPDVVRGLIDAARGVSWRQDLAAKLAAS